MRSNERSVDHLTIEKTSLFNSRSSLAGGPLAQIERRAKPQEISPVACLCVALPSTGSGQAFEMTNIYLAALVLLASLLCFLCV